MAGHMCMFPMCFRHLHHAAEDRKIISTQLLHRCALFVAVHLCQIRSSVVNVVRNVAMIIHNQPSVHHMVEPRWCDTETALLLGIRAAASPPRLPRLHDDLPN
mmetsp:Transcript_10571/g.17292  ORF Transcript_10571/g.17292 Transcript_10571/m.17292 type:complete len:103 (+) Transcript_10571:2521-2829(+)